jgi:hypothetical protein
MFHVRFSFFALCLTACTQDFGQFEPGPKDSGGPDTMEAAVDTGTGPDAGPCNNGAVYMGHCYFAVSPPATWAVQQANCVSAGGHLVTIGDPGEQAAITNVGSGDRWIGLSRPMGSSAVDTSYVWVNGEPRTYTNWAAGEPNGSGLAVRMHADGTWSDSQDNAPYVGLCERP